MLSLRFVIFILLIVLFADFGNEGEGISLHVGVGSFQRTPHPLPALSRSECCRRTGRQGTLSGILFLNVLVVRGGC